MRIEPGLRAVEVVVGVDEVDLASGLLWGTGVAAIGEVERDGSIVLTTDVPSGGIEAIEAALAGRWVATVVTVADDGLDGWRPFAEVVRAGARLVVQPPWIPFHGAPEDVVLSIDPGRSFGHGAHPTTRSCLAEIERLTGPGTSVLDVGCGSGVLAIAAARLGATPVVAIDVDPEAVVASTANVVANGVEVEVTDRPVQDVGGQFDLVVANIGATTLIELADAISERVAPNGALVLSGLLADRADDVIAAYTEFQLRSRVDVDDWVTLVLTR